MGDLTQVRLAEQLKSRQLRCGNQVLAGCLCLLAGPTNGAAPLTSARVIEVSEANWRRIAEQRSAALMAAEETLRKADGDRRRIREVR
jgi:hypothetical protein